MNKAIAERAVRALAELNTGRGTEARYAPAPVHAPVTQVEEPRGGEFASCGSPHCVGCYEVTPDTWIHPPKCGEDYRAWLERWEAKGRPQ
jgi:hypothetical protein